MMRRFFGRLAGKIAPRTFRNLKKLSGIRSVDGEMFERLAAYDDEVKQLRAELNELRRDNRRVVELYDAVFEKARRDTPLIDRS